MNLDAFLARLPRGDLWIFGYGSLMWAPDFPSEGQSIARLHGYHRALCILSHRYRGTPARPGLVMGLRRGGSCWGVAFRVAAQRVPRVLAGLWQREMRSRVYAPRLVTVRLGARTAPRGAARARSVRALAFVAQPSHPYFVGELGLRDRARFVAQGVGERGHCTDYIRNTLAHMRTLGVRDPHLERVLEAALALGRRQSRR